jgi:hypothetical protein
VHVRGGHTAARIVAEAEAAQLPPHRRDVLLGGDARVLARLERVLLGRQTERVVAHRVEHVVAGHPLEACVDVGADVAERVADVEAGPTGIREHVEHVELRAVGGLAEPVRQRSARVGRPERALVLPAVLPLLLDLAREARVVPVRRDVVGARFGRFGHRAASVSVNFWSPT